mgnify:CR=1 FL=1
MQNYKRSFGSRLFDTANVGLMIFLCVIMVYPLLYEAFLSLSEPEKLFGFNGFLLTSRGFTWQNYRRVFSTKLVLSGLKNTAFLMTVGLGINMLMTCVAAYFLTRTKTMLYRPVMIMILITMYFGGGLIPWYLVLKDLGFIDSIFVMTVPGLLSTYNMILMRNYFGTIPESLPESARIDGAHEFRILIQIIIPLAAPIIATISLFYAVGFWNEWWNAMLFLAKRDDLYPLQLLLRKIVIESTLDLGNEMANEFKNANINVYGVGMQMASVTVATIPIMCVYPFVQKYFASGIMLGAVKS